MSIIRKLGTKGSLGMSAVALSLCIGGCVAESEVEREGAAVEVQAEPVLETAQTVEAAEAAGQIKGAPELSAAATCEIHIGVTRASGNVISGYGSQANCGTKGTSYLTIQRSRWYGWEDLVTQTVTGSGHDVYVKYNCAGTGTHDFRTIHTARTIGGEPRFKESNHIRVSCS